MSRRWPLWVFLAAWVVRLAFVAEIRKAPYFDVPLVDGANYFRTAAVIASGDLLAGPHVFWQPPLYPYFLAALLALFGPRMEVIYAVQAAVGSLSCVLVYLIGRRLLSERAALWAAGIMIVYGPLVLFDAQPLIPVLHVALALAGILLLLRAGGISVPTSRRDGLLAGFTWGLAAVATPNILLTVPVAALWLLRRSRAAGPVLLFLAGVVAPVALVAGRNVVVAGESVIISSNGGINFFIGNNPDYERTLRIRPGGEFERLAQEPENLGIVGERAKSHYFTARALEFLTAYPGEGLRLYARKVLDLIAGREIPRNQEAYAYRRYSWLLTLLLWRRVIAFPFGVMAPLALAGACLSGSGRAAPHSVDPYAPIGEGAWRSGRALLLGYGASYAISILLFFPTDRYRLPLIPVAALLAGRLLGAPHAIWKRPAVIAALLCGLVLFNLDAATPGESNPEEEALNQAYALRMKGKLEEAKEEYRKAIALNPARIDPYNTLAAMAAQEGNWQEAAARYRDLLAIAPDFVEVRHGLGQAYMALGRREEARREWQIAVNLAPGAGLALADLCLSYYDEGFAVVAEPYCERAVRARPDLPEPHLALGLVARTLRKRDLAKAQLAEAARLFPRDSIGRAHALELLQKMLDYDRRRKAGEERTEGAALSVPCAAPAGPSSRSS